MMMTMGLGPVTGPPILTKRTPNCQLAEVIMLIGNKCDLDRREVAGFPYPPGPGWFLVEPEITWMMTASSILGKLHLL